MARWTCEHRHARGELVGPGPAVTPQQQVRDVHQEQDQARCEPRIPFHHTPHALRAHSGPVTSVNAPNTHPELRGGHGPTVRAGLFEEQEPLLALPPPDDRGNQEHPRRRHVEVVTLSRPGPSWPRSGAALMIQAPSQTFLRQCEHDVRRSLHRSVRHHRVKGPQRERQEHHVERAEQAQPELHDRQDRVSAAAAPRCRALRQSLLEPSWDTT